MDISENMNTMYKILRKKEEEGAVIYCKMPDHKFINAYIGIYEDGETRVVYLSSWNTIVCGYMFMDKCVMTFCTWIHSRSTVKHIGLFAKYACIGGETYYLMKDISQGAQFKYIPLHYGSIDNNKYVYNQTVNKLKQCTYKKKPIFNTDYYFNWINC